MLEAKYIPTVTVIVTTYSKERANHLLDCLQSIRKQTLEPKEILLVLDNPELKSFYASKLPQEVKVLTSVDSWGSSFARNTGIREARGEVVAFIDDDATADKDWLKNLAENYASSEVVGVTGFVAPVWQNGQRPYWFPEELDWVIGCSHKGLPPEKSFVRNPIGCNMSFRKEIIDKVGYFEGRFGAQPSRLLMRSEEAELSLRILRANPDGRIIYDPSAIVYHKVPTTRTRMKYIMRRSFYEGFSKRVLEESSQTSRALWVEKDYLWYLLRSAMVPRLKRVCQAQSCAQCLVLMLAIALVGMGYTYGLIVAETYTRGT
jgi:GT2 family glycosyltransferase